MLQIRAREASRAAARDGYDALFACAEQWFRLQDAVVGGMLASVEPLAVTWWNVNGAADEWMRLYLDGVEGALEQMRVVGDAVARNQRRMPEALRARGRRGAAAAPKEANVHGR